MNLRRRPGRQIITEISAGPAWLSCHLPETEPSYRILRPMSHSRREGKLIVSQRILSRFLKLFLDFPSFITSLSEEADSIVQIVVSPDGYVILIRRSSMNW